MQTLFAGWDGGGTATGVACVDAAGNTLAESRFGPLNLNGSDEETIEKTVRDCLARMRRPVRWRCGCKQRAGGRPSAHAACPERIPRALAPRGRS